MGAPEGICEMCNHQIIRYAHHLHHPASGRSLDCGCICAGRLEGDTNKARKREADFKNKQQRKINFKKREWKKSARGNEYLKLKNHLIVLFLNSNKWRFSIDNKLSADTYSTRTACIEAVFSALEKLLYT